jgi:hypothetical protein
MCGLLNSNRDQSLANNLVTVILAILLRGRSCFDPRSIARMAELAAGFNSAA